MAWPAGENGDNMNVAINSQYVLRTLASEITPRASCGVMIIAMILLAMGVIVLPFSAKFENMVYTSIIKYHRWLFRIIFCSIFFSIINTNKIENGCGYSSNRFKALHNAFRTLLKGSSSGMF
ncbi:unnamed protein product [Adineta ricciae]|uniref:Uncharacterized protein n=1 Tax=Adineta ricciae TaxID=249248 RepID=A0A815IVH4_ADIRI|nr:unnamed protein product [Adineta ricciae]